ncbi:hypothetical protein CAEBREN_07420 [Caenorhabditis brenneri]|uniref:Uncharacterized protein n=1 Tax=Caenorhabditis brenneri TaxID=135651 RepID=G0PKR0_CAEBE|nr:hypothetical protein CAEBREN_07420 [Caenorhabditis brenneri]
MRTPRHPDSWIPGYPATRNPTTMSFQISPGPDVQHPNPFYFQTTKPSSRKSSLSRKSSRSGRSSKSTKSSARSSSKSGKSSKKSSKKSSVKSKKLKKNPVGNSNVS